MMNRSLWILGSGILEWQHASAVVEWLGVWHTYSGTGTLVGSVHVRIDTVYRIQGNANAKPMAVAVGTIHAYTRVQCSPTHVIL